MRVYQAGSHLLEERGFARHRVRPTTYWRHGQSGN